jgi:hypothetical protein
MPYRFIDEVDGGHNIFFKVIRGKGSANCTGMLGIGRYENVITVPPPTVPMLLREIAAPTDITGKEYCLSMTLDNHGNITFDVAAEPFPRHGSISRITVEEGRVNMFIMSNVLGQPVHSTHWVIGADDVRSGVTGDKQVNFGAVNFETEGTVRLYFKFEPYNSKFGTLTFLNELNIARSEYVIGAQHILPIRVYESTP